MRKRRTKLRFVFPLSPRQFWTSTIDDCPVGAICFHNRRAFRTSRLHSRCSPVIGGLEYGRALTQTLQTSGCRPLPRSWPNNFPVFPLGKMQRRVRALRPTESGSGWKFQHVLGGHQRTLGCSTRLPLLPRERTSSVSRTTSEKCQWRKWAYSSPPSCG